LYQSLLDEMGGTLKDATDIGGYASQITSLS
jgi:hypothetical protein